MDKLYIILGYKSGISGGQIYVRNKKNYLEKNGWTVAVFDSLPNLAIYIDDLKKYSENGIKELDQSPADFSKKDVDAVINLIIKKSGWNSNIKQVVVESNTVTFSLWGELLAKRLNARHLVLLIDAFFTDDMRKGGREEYIDFKHKRRELAGIGIHSLEEYFKGYKHLPENEKYYLSFSCSNSVENTSYNLPYDVSKYDFVIGSVGRLNKPFVPEMVDEVCKFAKKHSDKKILFIILGGQTSGDNSIVTDRTSGAANIDVHITGLMFPFPLSLIKCLDVNIASSGSASVTVYENVKTIAVTDTSAKPLGVVGYSLRQRPYANNDSLYEGALCDLLEDVLLHNYCDRYDYVEVVKKPVGDLLEKRMSEHVEFLNQATQPLDYYNTYLIKSNNTLFRKIRRKLIHILRSFAPNLFANLIKLKRKSK